MPDRHRRNHVLTEVRRAESLLINAIERAKAAGYQLHVEMRGEHAVVAIEGRKTTNTG